jgi:hypothetical protein
MEAALAQVRLVQLVARAVLAEAVVNNQALAVQAQQDKEITVEAADSQMAARLAAVAAVLVLLALLHLGQPYQQAGQVQHPQLQVLASLMLVVAAVVHN